MSYAISASLQQAVYQALIADDAVDALVEGHVYDAVPPGTLPGLYVTIGSEQARDRSHKTGHGAEHDFTVAVVTDSAGFQDAKSAAAAISDALVDSSLSLARGTLVGLRFLKARARLVGAGDVRRIDLTFRARVDDV